MKKIVTILILMLLVASGLLIQQLKAQAPTKLSYQAIIRNADNEILAGEVVGMQISIIQGTADGTVQYVETHMPLSNPNGLVIITIGSGTVVSGDFSTIDWSNGDHFMKTEVDPEGGTSYTISGTSQLLSVPYALYAASAGNVFSGSYDDLTDVPEGLSDGDDDTQLTESEVDAYVADNGYLTAEVDGSTTNEIELPEQGGNSGKVLTTDGSSPAWSTVSYNDLTDVPASESFDGDFSSLTSIPSGLSDGDDDTQLSESQVDTYVANNGYLTSFTEVDGSITNEIELPTQTGNSGKMLTTDGSSPAWSAVSFDDLTDVPSGLSDGDDNTQLSESQVDTYVSNNGYLTSFTEVDGSITNEIELPTQTGNSGKMLTTDGSSPSWSTVSFNDLSDVPSGISDGDDNTQLSESQVDTYVSNNGYLTSFTEVDGSVTNELELPAQTGNSGKYLTTDGSSVSWDTPSGSSSSVKTISGNTTLLSTDHTVIINGAFTATFPASPTDGQLLILVTNSSSAGINGNGRSLLVANGSFSALTFADVTSNMYTFVYSSTINAWMGTY